MIRQLRAFCPLLTQQELPWLQRQLATAAGRGGGSSQQAEPEVRRAFGVGSRTFVLREAWNLRAWSAREPLATPRQHTARQPSSQPHLSV